MRYRALKILRGDYGPNRSPAVIHPGTVFEVPDYLKSIYSELERNGLIARENVERKRLDRKSYTVYQSKPAEPPQDKALQPEEIKPVAPEVIATVPLEDKRRGRRFKRR